MASAKESKSGGGGIVALLIPALIALGGGAGLGLYIGEQQKKSAQPAKAQKAEATPAEEEKPKGEHGAEGGHGAEAHGSGHGEENVHKDGKASEAHPKLQIKSLPPIITNLGEPPNALVRLQSAIVYDPTKVQTPDVLMAQLTEDIVALLKTLSMSSIEGAEGLRQLNEDLKDRAAIRSNHAVHEFVIESVVIQ